MKAIIDALVSYAEEKALIAQGFFDCKTCFELYYFLSFRPSRNASPTRSLTL